MTHRGPDAAAGPGAGVHAGRSPSARPENPDAGHPELDFSELAPRCAAMLDWVRRTGGEVTITLRGRPVARLVPVGDVEEDEERASWDIEAVAP